MVSNHPRLHLRPHYLRATPHSIVAGARLRSDSVGRGPSRHHCRELGSQDVDRLDDRLQELHGVGGILVAHGFSLARVGADVPEEPKMLAPRKQLVADDPLLSHRSKTGMKCLRRGVERPRHRLKRASNHYGRGDMRAGVCADARLTVGLGHERGKVLAFAIRRFRIQLLGLGVVTFGPTRGDGGQDARPAARRAKASPVDHVESLIRVPARAMRYVRELNARSATCAREDHRFPQLD